MADAGRTHYTARMDALDIRNSPHPEPLSSAVERQVLAALGDRVRLLRARRGMTRKAVALASGVSERHLANLEYGTGNASVLILERVARALESPLAELLGDVTASSPEWLLLRELLQGRGEADLRRARQAVAALFGEAPAARARARRLALVGLRGAGKSTLGAMLAEALELPFIELSREIEKVAGCSIREIHDLYGAAAYRRYERRAIEAVVGAHEAAVIATPGGLVAEPATFGFLLDHATTVWLQASPEEHMGRVAAQGDTRPMAASPEAMDDLRRILAGRAAFYAKADAHYDTAGQSLDRSFEGLLALVRRLEPFADREAGPQRAGMQTSASMV